MYTCIDYLVATWLVHAARPSAVSTKQGALRGSSRVPLVSVPVKRVWTLCGGRKVAGGGCRARFTYNATSSKARPMKRSHWSPRTNGARWACGARGGSTLASCTERSALPALPASRAMCRQWCQCRQYR